MDEYYDECGYSSAPALNALTAAGGFLRQVTFEQSVKRHAQDEGVCVIHNPVAQDTDREEIEEKMSPSC
ncbi:MAG: hypothetical protein V7642_367 [Burkholderiales bacterium]|jgi:hypothetical protein